MQFWEVHPSDNMRIQFIMSVLIQLQAFIKQTRHRLSGPLLVLIVAEEIKRRP